jgi:hypothetical protein
MSEPLDGWSNARAYREGWKLAKLFNEDTLRIIGAEGGEFRRKYRGQGWPLINMKALAFVQQKAREGSAYHIEALARTQLL